LSQRIFRLGRGTQGHCMRWLSNEIANTNATQKPVLTIYLPKLQDSRNFVVTHRVGSVKDLEGMIQGEDSSVQSVSALGADGITYASSTPLTYLMEQGFQLDIADSNQAISSVQLPPMPSLVDDVNGVKEKIKALAGTLDIVENKMNIESDLYQRLSELKAEIGPLEEKKQALVDRSQFRTQVAVWGGLLAMGAQFGFLARLVWWDYSWDIMEPVTYFVTYGTAIGMYAYFVCVKSEYNFDSAADRIKLRSFHKGAKRQQLDIERYNVIQNQMKEIEHNLTALNNVGALLAVKEKINVPQD